MNDSVWVFHGEKASLCCAVFSSQEQAERWIARNNASGLLTRMPLDTSIYDWAIDNAHFSPEKEIHQSSGFIQTFTSGYLEHHHYDSGRHLE